MGELAEGEEEEGDRARASAGDEETRVRRGKDARCCLTTLHPYLGPFTPLSLPAFLPSYRPVPNTSSSRAIGMQQGQGNQLAAELGR